MKDYTMSDPVNMVQLVTDLPSRPRGRACVVLTHEYNSQREWAAELARQTDSEHLDLLDLFTQDKALGDRIGKFLIPDLFNFLKAFNQKPVLIISGMEFLKATWTSTTIHRTVSKASVILKSFYWVLISSSANNCQR
jgi:hypothetical protein